MQRRQSLRADNLGAVLRSAKNAARLGTQQFETPSGMAEALMLPLTACRPFITDLQCGHGSLLAAAVNESTRDVFGVDIDPTASVRPSRKLPSCLIHEDLNLVTPLLREVGWKSDLMVLNPPFSLQWPDGDSTLVTWRLTHEFLTATGEGMMICNAATARRLILPTPEARRIWLHVLSPNFFPGTDPSMELAVLYFAADHHPEPSETPLQFRLLDTDPGHAREALAQFTNARRRLVRGDTLRHLYDATDHSKQFRAVAAEVRRRQAEHLAGRDGWNIRLQPDGRLDVWLTPFQHFSAKVPRALAEELQSLHQKHPASLVVQKPSRLALHRAVSGNLWRVEAAAVSAVTEAVKAYHAIRAPFSRLNPVQRLAYLDEEDTIRCTFTTGHFSEGRHYPITTQTFEGRKLERRRRPGRGHEEVLVSGQELAILVTDDTGRAHSFTQFPPKDDLSDERPEADSHHLLSDLVAWFHIPDVPDVATLHPGEYAEFMRRLLALETAA